jgi:hypothetical protein
MDSVMKNFLSSGRTLIYDTMEVKSALPKVSKKSIEKPVEVVGPPLEMLIKRVKDESLSKMDVVEVFKKIIAAEEELI